MIRMNLRDGFLDVAATCQLLINLLLTSDLRAALQPQIPHYGLKDDKSKVFCVNVESFRIATLEGQVP